MADSGNPADEYIQLAGDDEVSSPTDARANQSHRARKLPTAPSASRAQTVAADTDTTDSDRQPDAQQQTGDTTVEPGLEEQRGDATGPTDTSDSADTAQATKATTNTSGTTDAHRSDEAKAAKGDEGDQGAAPRRRSSAMLLRFRGAVDNVSSARTTTSASELAESTPGMIVGTYTLSRRHITCLRTHVKQGRAMLKQKPASLVTVIGERRMVCKTDWKPAKKLSTEEGTNAENP